MAKRVKAFDIFRGSMIFYSILLHALIQRVFMCDGDQFANVMGNISLWSILAIFPLIYISLWGSSFVFLSGSSVAYSMASRVKKNPEELGSQLKDRMISSVLLYVVYLIQKIFFNAQTSVNPYPTHSLLTGALETGDMEFPELIHILTSDTLEALAIVGFILALLFYFLWRKNGFDAKKTNRVLITIGSIMMILTVVLRIVIGDPDSIKYEMVDQKKFVAYYFFLRLYAERFAILPVYGFAFFGAVFGIKLANGESYKQIAKYGFITGGVFLSVFLSQVIVGFDIVAGFASEMVPWPLQFNVIGSQIITLSVLLRIFDFNKKPFPKHREKTTSFLTKYSNISLTIYILEPTLSQVVHIVYNLFYKEPLYTNFSIMVSFFIVCIGLWIIIVMNWAKIKNVGSFEWFMGQGKRKIKQFLAKRIEIRKSRQVTSPVPI